jgi:hypothetical protein
LDKAQNFSSLSSIRHLAGELDDAVRAANIHAIASQTAAAPQKLGNGVGHALVSGGGG